MYNLPALKYTLSMFSPKNFGIVWEMKTQTNLKWYKSENNKKFHLKISDFFLSHFLLQKYSNLRDYTASSE
jgi:hypothetical protein